MKKPIALSRLSEEDALRYWQKIIRFKEKTYPLSALEVGLLISYSRSSINNWMKGSQEIPNRVFDNIPKIRPFIHNTVMRKKSPTGSIIHTNLSVIVNRRLNKAIKFGNERERKTAKARKKYLSDRY